MKKFSFLVATLLLLTACSTGSSSSSTETPVTRQSFKSFTIDIPDTFRKVNKEDFANTIPDQTVALFVERNPVGDFIQNVNVVKESLNTDASSLEYAKANVLLGTKTIAQYRLLSQEEVTINGIKTVLHLFQARNTPSEPYRQYYQAYFAQDRVGYTATCIAKDDDTVSQGKCTTMLKSFRML